MSDVRPEATTSLDRSASWFAGLSQEQQDAVEWLEANCMPSDVFVRPIISLIDDEEADAHAWPWLPPDEDRWLPPDEDLWWLGGMLQNDNKWVIVEVQPAADFSRGPEYTPCGGGELSIQRGAVDA